MANPGGVLPPEGREEAKKKKGAPAEAAPVDEHQKNPGFLTGSGDDPKYERSESPAKFGPGGNWVRPSEKEQEAAPHREGGWSEKPPPDFMPDADSQGRQSIWEGLTPEQKDAILSVSAAPSPLPGQGGYQSSKGRGSEITGGGRQPDPQRKTKEGKYIYGEKAPMERSPDFYTEMDTLRRAAQNEE